LLERYFPISLVNNLKPATPKNKENILSNTTLDFRYMRLAVPLEKRTA
jgi:hypothetical protein